MRKQTLTDGQLCASVVEMLQGLIDADLGGGIVKKRVGTGGRGKRGGMRTLLATHFDGAWFFLVGFAKNDRANITNAELQALRALANELLPLSPAQLALAVHAGTLLEICHALATQQHPG